MAETLVRQGAPAPEIEAKQPKFPDIKLPIHRKAAASGVAAMHNGKPPIQQDYSMQELKRELDRLFELQHRALDRATHLGMTPDEAKEVETRRKQITVLVDRLAASKGAN